VASFAFVGVAVATAAVGACGTGDEEAVLATNAIRASGSRGWCSGSASVIMMETTEHGSLDDGALGRRGSGDRLLLCEGLMQT
jgi:hypothetical protein